MTTFKDVDKQNLAEYIQLESTFDPSVFMSRTRPVNFETGDTATLFWKYIIIDEKTVGSIWLEKESAFSNTADLGIFLSDESDRKKGIGSAAIRSAIGLSWHHLLFKTIRLRVRPSNLCAIHCFETCGFSETGRFQESLGNLSFEMVEMALRISTYCE